MAEDLFSTLSAKFNAFSSLKLKAEQLECLDALLADRHVFCMLPTGYGKTMIFALFPLLKSEAEGKHCVALVISPLRALMLDQVHALEAMGLMACVIMQDGPPETAENIDKGHVDVVLASPEAILQPFWLDKVTRLNLCVLAFDEAHCISTWGLDFRPEYRNVAKLVSEFPSVPTLMLTATATAKVQQDLYDLLALDEDITSTIAVIPDRPNIYMYWEKVVESPEKVLPWLSTYLKEHNMSSRKIIVYCRTTRACMNVFTWLSDELGVDAFVNRQQKSDKRLLEMFHSHIDDDSKKRVCANFTSGNVRLVVATVAFGMGVDTRDVDIVLHWGVESSALTYWQEMGRCARDGRSGMSITYVFASSLHSVPEEDPLHAMLIQPEACRRQKLLEQFRLPTCRSAPIASNQCDNKCITCLCHLCLCCSSCCATCTCDGRKVNFMDRL